MASSRFPQQFLNPLRFVLSLVPNRGRLAVLATAGVLSALILFMFSDSLDTLEERLGELGWTLAAETAPEQRMTVVAIDEKSLAEVGPWPWTRQQMARLVNEIDAAGAQLQLHDIVYSEAKPGDAELLEALQSARGAVLAQLPILQSDNSVRARVGTMSYPLSGVSCDGAFSAAIPATQNFLTAAGAFAAVPKGHITPIVAADGAIRNFPALVCVDGTPYPAISISALLQATNSQDWGARLSRGTSWFSPPLMLQFDAYPGLDIPLDEAGNLRISYKNSPDSYLAVSAADVMAGNLEPGLLENTWVLVGATAFGIGDIVPTPYSGATPGIELQARIMGSLLDTEIPYTPRAASGVLASLALIFAAILLGISGMPGRWSAYGLPAAGVLLPLLALALHIQLLSSVQIWLGWLVPALYSLLAASLLVLLEHSRVRGERSRVYDNLSSYLPGDLAKEIAYSLPSSTINAKRCDVTLLSADLRNFAAFGEARPPEESASVLHFFFTRATEIVEQHGGRVYEFKGDSLLAVWDGNHQQAADQALQAAQEMQQAIDEESLSPESLPGLEPLALGIGIEQGPVLIGSIGASHRRSHALLGDTVTITLRIQELTAELAQPILIGECAARQLNDRSLQSQGSYLLSGLRIPHALFAPTDSDSQLRRSNPEQPVLKVVSSNNS